MFLVPFTRSNLDSKPSPLKSQGLASQLSLPFQPIPLALTPASASKCIVREISLPEHRRFLTLIQRSSSLATRYFFVFLARLKQWLTISIGALLAVIRPLNNYYSIRWSRVEPELAEQAEQLSNTEISTEPNSAELNLDESDDYQQSLNKAQLWCVEASATLDSECTHHNIRSDRRSGNNGMDLFRRGAPQRAASHGSNSNNNNNNGQHHEHASPMCCWGRYSMPRERSGCAAEGGPKVADTVAEGLIAHREQQTPNAFQEQRRQQWRSCGFQTENGGIASQVQRLWQQQQHQQQPQRGQTDSHKHGSLKYNATCEAHSPSGSSSAARLMNAYQIQQGQKQQQDLNHLAASALQNNANVGQDNGFSAGKTEVDDRHSQMVLVDKETLSELTDKIAFSMNKMKDLEEQVRVIPELKRRLENVISDSNSGSLKDYNIKQSRFNGNDDTYSVHGQADNGADVLRSLHPALQRHYNSFRHTSSGRPANNSMERPNVMAKTANNTANSLDARSPTMLGSQDSGSMLLALDNNSHRGSRQSFGRFTNQDSSTSRGSGAKIGSPKVEYEDLINDLISLSYSVNYASNSNSENSQSSDQPQQHQQQQVKESTAPHEDLQQQQQQHGRNLATRRNYSSIGNLADSMPTAAHHINHKTDDHHSSILIGSNNNNANGNGNRSCSQNANNGALNHHNHQAAPLSPAPDTIGWRRANKQSQQLNYNYDKNIAGNYCGPKTSTAIKTKAGLDSSSLLHSSASSSQQLNSNRYHSNILSAFHLTNYHNQNNSSNRNMILDPSQPSFTYHYNHNQHQQSTFNQRNSIHNNSKQATLSYLPKTYNGNGSLSLQTTPVKSQLDCGCQSFKEHLRYNSISREQRLNHAKSQSLSATTITASNASSDANSPHRSAPKTDASTNTELSMSDIVTRVELNDMMVDMQKTYSTLSSSNLSRQFRSMFHKSSSLASESSSGSVSGPKSSSANPSRSDSCEMDENAADDDNTASGGHKSDTSSGKDDHDKLHEPSSSENEPDACDDEGEEEEEDEADTNVGSFAAEGPYSLGSSYQDPSDFEEYCAYGASIDRHTKDFMSQSTKIPNDLRFALIRLNDFIKRKRSIDQIESSSSCIEVIKKEWFEAAASKDSQPIKTKLYVDYFESFTKQLLNTVVNLADSAGNTAMHYAASHFKLDIIDVLLGTKVCDVNSRNRAGYTPIMLLALAEIESPYEQEVASRLFRMGDVNVKARTDGQTALMLAASHGRMLTCKLLLECGADPSMQDFDGSTALMCGSERGNEDVVKCLLAHKLTDPAALDNDGLDALTIAMNNGHKNIGLLLYAAKNVPRLARPSINPVYNNTSGYLCASLRRSRGKLANNYVRRADSLLNYATSKTG